ncbi:amidase [Amycolatopsis benzoatilytica]|uniref:amidase n=1 Tax=Amycolatopsis benzoatilytica TaxID=346045 RepID=UPI00037ABA84|nr:amidase [Amycolatopsis benzoatilytica]
MILARSAAEHIANGTVRARDLTAACLAAIDAVEASVSAFAHTDREGALRQATALDGELARGGPRSALHGIPIAVKDNIDVAGMPTAAGSALLGGAAPSSTDAAIVRALRAAGAVILGKTRLPEFAVGAVTPSTRNPWDTDRIAGGSSGGSAAAVAAGECYGAPGTDTGGSVRIPAALCGVVGLMPRRHSVPRSGIIPVSPRLDACGPIARTVADTALLWNRMLPSDAPPRDRPLCVGRVANNLLGAVEPDVLRAVAASVDALGSVPNVRIVDVRPPRFDDSHPHRRVPLLVDAADMHRARGWFPQYREKYSDRLRAFLEHGSRLARDHLYDALDELRPLVGAFMHCFDDCDVIALPTVPVVAPRIAALADDRANLDQPPVDRTLTRLCAPMNFCPVAALTMPCGISIEGLPIGLQLVAPEEAAVFQCAHLIEHPPGPRYP